jgi:Peptidase family M28
MLKFTHLLFITLLAFPLSAQTNFLITNTLADSVLNGNYNPADYAAGAVISDPALIATEINTRISPDSLQSYITALSSFGNRNTGSDTVSASWGIGAARRWVLSQFQSFSAENDNRLLTGYFQFDRIICSVGRHRNIMAVLPGTDPDPNGVILVEGHIDSRCEVLCDTACLAEGVEDNASGTALVMDLARVMSRYSFKNTIVFMVVVGEEQGLYGAEAFAIYCKNNNIPVRAVLNNDVIGGVICGETSSPPSCPGFNDVDSTSVRLFSSGNFNSPHKQLARYIKLQYQENLLATATVPMLVRIMSPEDRTGRGGDHIPFRSRGYPAMRFTAANEHGDAGIDANYADRQHTTRDVLGVDTDNDGAVDSFFVQFNYLARNAVINGNALAMIARGVSTPLDFSGIRSGSMLILDIADADTSGVFRIALRTTTNDWDTVYTLTGSNSGIFPCNPTGALYVSVARVDDAGIESLFSIEKVILISSTEEAGAAPPEKPIRLFQNRPNPFDEATWISFWVNEVPSYRQAMIQIVDMGGKVIEEMEVELKQGMNEVMYTHGYGVRGAFQYALLIDGEAVDARKMVFAN